MDRSDHGLLIIGAVALTFLGVLVILTTSLLWLGSVLLGTGTVGWYVLDRKDRVHANDIDEIERYANKRDDT